MDFADLKETTMNTLVVRFAVCLVGTLPALFVVPKVHAEVPIFYGGYTQLAPIAGGSYVHWVIHRSPSDYERQPDLTVGQQWTGDGMDHQVQYYDFHRAFLVFDVPRYKGVVTRDEIGIPDWAVRDVTLLRTKVTGAAITFQGVKEDDVGEDINPIEVRWSPLSASALMDGTIDPEVAFNGLLSGPRVDADLVGLGASTSPTQVSLNDSFTDFLNHTNGGSVVFSFAMPTFDKRATLDLKYLVPDISLYITFDGYAPFAPVPEPSMYACVGAAFCGILALRRAVKFRRSRSPDFARMS